MPSLTRSSLFYAVFFILFINYIAYVLFLNKNQTNSPDLQSLQDSLSAIQTQLNRNVFIYDRLLSAITPAHLTLQTIIPVLVLACNRVTVKRTLDALFQARKITENLLGPSFEFPIIVSRDCQHALTASLLESYGDKITLLRQPDQSAINVGEEHTRFVGYYHVSRHYKWALDQIFSHLNYEQVIIVEDDLDIAPDFFSYFAATLPYLISDPTLFCVSAWNDNGRKENVDLLHPELIYRSDFFPGLGWMLVRTFWLEVRSKWPPGFWDEYLRRPDVRHGRGCLRPEVSRTVTFGREGVSNGQFYDSYLQHLYLNDHPVDFRNFSLSYLAKPIFDMAWAIVTLGGGGLVEVKPELILSDNFQLESLSETLQVTQNLRPPPLPPAGSLRVVYTDHNQFVQLAKKFNIMSDIKAGVPRTAYQGVVTTLFKGVRVYLIPGPKVQDSA